MKLLKKLREDRLKSYKVTPGDIEEHRRAELRVAGDTAGRPLIELIQNADDAMNQYVYSSQNRNRIKIILQDNKLLVANDGAPFTKEGVEAICNLDRSPKRDRRITIGNKGIGFKSILTWTQKPLIYSRTFEFTFDRERSAEDISQALGKRYQTNDVPLMRLPYPPIRRHKLVEELFKEGFATVIVLELKNETVVQSVLEELENFDPLTFLFLNAVSNVSIETDNFNHQYRILRGENQIDIETNENRKNYRVFRAELEIPKEISSTLPEDYCDLTHGTISIALPQEPLRRYPMIFSYFPTHERGPFKFLIHGDFILDAGRKHLRGDAKRYNQWLISEIAQLFAEEVIASFDVHDSTLIDFLECRSPEDMELVEKWIFEAFASTIGEKNFLPVMKNLKRLVSPRYAGLVEEETLNEISELFEGEVQWENRFLIEPEWTTKPRLQTLEKLGGREFTKPELVKMLGAKAKPDPLWCTKALNIVLNWIGNAPEWSGDEPSKSEIREALQQENLFLTINGELRPLVGNDFPPLFLPPDKHIEIPPFIDLDFLDPKIGNGLEGENLERFRKGLSRLSKWGLYPFRPREIVKEAVLPLLNRDDDPINSNLSFKRDFLLFLVQLEPNKEKFHKTDPYPWFDELRTQLAYKVCVPTENGQWVPAWKVYASKEWGAPNELIEIYEDMEDTHFLASPNYDIHNGVPIEKWKSLYRYLGVSWEPKILPFENEPEYIYKSSFPNPHPTHVLPEDWEQYRDYCANTDELSDMWRWSIKLEESYALDNWKTIREDTDKCLNLFKLLYQSEIFNYIVGPRKEKVKCRFRYTKRTCSHPATCDSVLLWSIKHSNWLPSMKGELFAPAEIFLEDSEIGRGLRGFVPILQTQKPKEKKERRRFEDLLDEIGVRTNWDQITIEDWLHWLNRLSEASFQSSRESIATAQTLYRYCLERCETPQTNKPYKPFSNINVLSLSTNNQYKFKKAEEVIYFDEPRLDAVKKKLIEHGYSLFIVELGGKSRARKAKELFGMILASEIIKEEVIKGPPNYNETEKWKEKFKRLQPILLARLAKDRPKSRTEDEEFFRSTSLCVVENLRRRFNLVDSGKTLLEEEVPACWSSSDTTIYLNINNNEKRLWSALAECLSQRLGQTYYEAFENLLSCDSDAERLEKLRKAGVSEDDVLHCERALSEEPISTSSITDDSKEQITKEKKTTEDSNEHDITPEVLQEKMIDEQILDPSMGEFKRDSDIGINVGTTGMETQDKSPTQKQPIETHKSRISSKEKGSNTHIEERGIELAAMKWAIKYEKEHNREPRDVSHLNLGYDIESTDLQTREKRYIEVKGGKGKAEKREITVNEWEEAKKKGDNYYIYYVLGLGESEGEIRIFRNPFKKLKVEEKVFKISLPREYADEVKKFQKKTKD